MEDFEFVVIASLAGFALGVLSGGIGCFITAVVSAAFGFFIAALMGASLDE